MDEFENHELRINKDTQKFIKELSELPKEKCKKVKSMLYSLSNQQNSEAKLEKNRGWRYMWQRTPKPYLIIRIFCIFWIGRKFWILRII